MTVWLLVALAILLSAPANAGRRRALGLAGSGRLVQPSSPSSPWPSRRRAGSGADDGLLVRDTSARSGSTAAAATGALAGYVIGGPAIAVAGGAVAAVAWAGGRRVVVTRTASRRRADLLRSVRLMIAELDAGATTASALTAAAGAPGMHARVFAAAAVTAEHGGDPASVLGSSGELSGIAQALRIAEQTGAAPAAVLDRVAADVTAVADQRRAAAVSLAGPRSSAAVLAGLPLLGIGLGVAMAADPVGFLLGSGPGRLVCAVGVLLDVAGVCWMARIVRRAERA